MKKRVVKRHAVARFAQQLRGMADRMALRLAHHDETAHRRLRPGFSVTTIVRSGKNVMPHGCTRPLTTVWGVNATFMLMYGARVCPANAGFCSLALASPVSTGWPVTWRTLNTTLLFAVVQFASCAGT